MLGRGWRERLVDVTDDVSDPLHLRMVLAPNATPASKLLLPRRLQVLPPDAGQQRSSINLHVASLTLLSSLFRHARAF